MIFEKTKFVNFSHFLSVHLKKVKAYMVSDEFKLHITFYNRSRHMHDMPQKLTLIESYLVRPIMRVSMPSLQGWLHVAGSSVNSNRHLTYPLHNNPANNMSWCVIRVC